MVIVNRLALLAISVCGAWFFTLYNIKSNTIVPPVILLANNLFSDSTSKVSIFVGTLKALVHLPQKSYIIYAVFGKTEFLAEHENLSMSTVVLLVLSCVAVWVFSGFGRKGKKILWFYVHPCTMFPCALYQGFLYPLMVSFLLMVLLIMLC